MINACPPNTGESIIANPDASPFLGDGIRERKSFIMKIKEMFRSKTGSQSGMKCALA